MKLLKEFMRYIFVVIGVWMVMMLAYFASVENPEMNWLLFVSTSILSSLFGLWICDVKQRKDGADNE
jgi:hypothetical protein